uniref:DNA topoisomerase 2 n=1 Tax=Serratia phage Kevin TaxID=3161161 RepID=A0AAU8L0G8_9CAUD
MTDINVGRKYKRLDHIQHILLRPERHLGSIRSAKLDTWVYDPSKDKVVFKTDFEYSPALVKQFDEIITNCVDHSKTPEGSHLNEITVTVTPMTGQIIIADNGGIPVVRHPDNNEWVPEMLFGSLYSGSNFNDDDPDYNNKTGGGQNGEGASLVNVFSTWFRVSTNDGKKTFSQTFTENMSKRDLPTISNMSCRGTAVAWIPDYKRLGLERLDSNNIMMLYRRAFEVAACNPKLKVVLNGQQIRIDRFGHFVDYFCSPATVDENSDWMVGISPSAGAFAHYSYVNSVPTLVGGPHVDYVADQIVNAIRPELEKKLKAELKPAMIKNHMCLYISATINNPRFDSQTKERMTTPVSQFGTTFKPSSRLINKAKTIVFDGLKKELSALRNEAADAEMDKSIKDISKRDTREIEKYYPATARDRKDAVLVLTEGDSASAPVLAARTKNIGLYSLRGKFINVVNNSRAKLYGNEEFKSLCSILGVTPGQSLDLANLRYQFVCISTDADDDGKHIRGLIILLFCTYWPEFVKAGRLIILRTPYMRCWVGKKMHEFMNQADYDVFYAENHNKITKKKYLKGLGGNSTEDFRRFLENLGDYTDVITLDDGHKAALSTGFDNEQSDSRKEWFSDVCLYTASDE